MARKKVAHRRSRGATKKESLKPKDKEEVIEPAEDTLLEELGVGSVETAEIEPKTEETAPEEVETSQEPTETELDSTETEPVHTCEVASCPVKQLAQGEPEPKKCKEVPLHLRCPACFQRYGGVGKRKHEWRRGTIRIRVYRCCECGAEFKAELTPKDFEIDGVHYTVQTLTDMELKFLPSDGQEESGEKESHEENAGESSEA